MNPGDFVRHSRQGAGRIVEIHPDFIEVRAAAGHVFKVNKALAEFELQKYPADGLVALVASRRVSSEFLLENAQDIILRVFRDRRKTSLSQRDIREELEPLIQRDGMAYAGWWKKAKPKILSGGAVAVDPKKKTNLILGAEIKDARSTNWTEEFLKIRNSSELLEFGRRLHAAEDNEAAAAEFRAKIVQRAAGELQVSEKDPRRFLERLLGLIYVGFKADDSSKKETVSVLDGIDFGLVRPDRDLEEDVTIALGILAKAIPSKAAEWAATLKDFPERRVARRAFNVLNTERFRFLLKEPFLKWLRSESQSFPNLDLYLDDTFLRNIRREDRAALFIRISQRHEHSTAESQFLTNPEHIQLVAEAHQSDPAAALRSISSAALGEQERLEMAKSLGPNRLLIQMLGDYRPEYVRYLPPVINECDWDTILAHSSEVVALLHRASSMDAIQVFEKRFASSIPELQPIDLLRAATSACQLKDIVPREHVGSFDRTLANAFSRLLNSRDELQPLNAALNSAVAAANQKLIQELTVATAELSRLQESSKQAEDDSARLKGVVEFVKASAKDDRSRLKLQVLSDFISGILPAIDGIEVEAESRAEMSQQSFVALLGAFERSGVYSIGVPGEVVRFDPTVHKLIENECGEGGMVTIVRRGFTYRDVESSTTIRPALVRCVEETRS